MDQLYFFRTIECRLFRLALYSLCLISLLTFLLASGFSLTDTNFSVIGSRGGRRPLFLLWGALTGNFFYLYTDNLFMQTGCADRLVRGLLWGALFLFVTAVGIPYLPKLLPDLARLHVEISFLAPLFLGASQMRFLHLLQKKAGTVFRMQWIFMGALGMGSAVLFLSIGIVTSLLEIYLIFGICIYLLGLHRKLGELRLLNSC